MRFGAVLAVVVWALGALAVSAADRNETVTFPQGAPFVQVAGTIAGWDVAHYRVQAAAGQQLRVQLSADRGGTSFNIVPPVDGAGRSFKA